VRETADQKYLSAAARMRNVLHAFTVASELVVSGKDIILVDDVMTTGSTLNEAARTVKLAGARSAVAAVAASGLGYPCMCERWKDTGSRS
ncbi:MAG: phosphoribosyltransferase family protein, partial [Bacillota bacterium]